MKSTVQVILGSLIGSLAIHGALSACGGGGETSANAQTSSSTCTTWQVATTEVPESASTMTPGVIPTGWEPFGLSGTNGYGQENIVVRQCAP
jgi:hypothetical protein